MPWGRKDETYVRLGSQWRLFWGRVTEVSTWRMKEVSQEKSEERPRQTEWHTQRCSGRKPEWAKFSQVGKKWETSLERSIQNLRSHTQKPRRPGSSRTDQCQDWTYCMTIFLLLHNLRISIANLSTIYLLWKVLAHWHRSRSCFEIELLSPCLTLPYVSKHFQF